MYNYEEQARSANRPDPSFRNNINQTPASAPGEVLKSTTGPQWAVTRPVGILPPNYRTERSKNNHMTPLVESEQYQRTVRTNNTNQHNIIRPQPRTMPIDCQTGYSPYAYYPTRSAPHYVTAENVGTIGKLPMQFTTSDPYRNSSQETLQKTPTDARIMTYPRYATEMAASAQQSSVPSLQERIVNHHIPFHDPQNKDTSHLNCTTCQTSSCAHMQRQTACAYAPPIPTLQQPSGTWSGSHPQTDMWAIREEQRQHLPIEGIDMSVGNPYTMQYFERKNNDSGNSDDSYKKQQTENYQIQKQQINKLKKLQSGISQHGRPLEWSHESHGNSGILQPYPLGRYPDPNQRDQMSRAIPSHLSIPLHSTMSSDSYKLPDNLNYINSNSHLHSRLTTAYPPTNQPQMTKSASYFPHPHSNYAVPVSSHPNMNSVSASNQSFSKPPYSVSVSSYANPPLNSCNERYENINYGQTMQVVDNSAVNKGGVPFQQELHQAYKPPAPNYFDPKTVNNLELSSPHMAYNNAMYRKSVMESVRASRHKLHPSYGMIPSSGANIPSTRLIQKIPTNYQHEAPFVEMTLLDDCELLRKRCKQGEVGVIHSINREPTEIGSEKKRPADELRKFYENWDAEEVDEAAETTLAETVETRKPEEMAVVDWTNLHQDNLTRPNEEKCNETEVPAYKLDAQNENIYTSVIKPLKERQKKSAKVMNPLRNFRKPAFAVSESENSLTPLPDDHKEVNKEMNRASNLESMSFLDESVGLLTEENSANGSVDSLGVNSKSSLVDGGPVASSSLKDPQMSTESIISMQDFHNISLVLDGKPPDSEKNVCLSKSTGDVFATSATIQESVTNTQSQSIPPKELASTDNVPNPKETTINNFQPHLKPLSSVSLQNASDFSNSKSFSGNLQSTEDSSIEVDNVISIPEVDDDSKLNEDLFLTNFIPVKHFKITKKKLKSYRSTKKPSDSVIKYVSSEMQINHVMSMEHANNSHIYAKTNELLSAVDLSCKSIKSKNESISKPIQLQNYLEVSQEVQLADSTTMDRLSNLLADQTAGGESTDAVICETGEESLVHKPTDDIALELASLCGTSGNVDDAVSSVEDKNNKHETVQLQLIDQDLHRTKSLDFTDCSPISEPPIADVAKTLRPKHGESPMPADLQSAEHNGLAIPGILRSPEPLQSSSSENLCSPKHLQLPALDSVCSPERNGSPTSGDLCSPENVQSPTLQNSSSTERSELLAPENLSLPECNESPAPENLSLPEQLQLPAPRSWSSSKENGPPTPENLSSPERNGPQISENLCSPEHLQSPAPENLSLPELNEPPAPENLSLPERNEPPAPENLSLPERSELPAPENLSLPEQFQLPAPRSWSSSKENGPQTPENLSSPERNRPPTPENLSLPELNEPPAPENLSLPERNELPAPENLSLPERSELPAPENLSLPERSELPAPENLSLPERSELPALENLSLPEQLQLPAPRSWSSSKENGPPTPENSNSPERNGPQIPENLCSPEHLQSPALENLSLPERSEPPALQNSNSPERNGPQISENLCSPEHLQSPAPENSSLSERSESPVPENLCSPEHLQSPAPENSSLSERSESPVPENLCSPEHLQSPAPENSSLSERSESPVPENLCSPEHLQLPRPENLCSVERNVTLTPENSYSSEHLQSPAPGDWSSSDCNGLLTPENLSRAECIKSPAPDNVYVSEFNGSPISENMCSPQHLHLPARGCWSSPESNEPPTPENVSGPECIQLPTPENVLSPECLESTKAWKMNAYIETCISQSDQCALADKHLSVKEDELSKEICEEIEMESLDEDNFSDNSDLAEKIENEKVCSEKNDFGIGKERLVARIGASCRAQEQLPAAKHHKESPDSIDLCNAGTVLKEMENKEVIEVDDFLESSTHSEDEKNEQNCLDYSTKELLKKEQNGETLENLSVSQIEKTGCFVPNGETQMETCDVNEKVCGTSLEGFEDDQLENSELTEERMEFVGEEDDKTEKLPTALNEENCMDFIEENEGKNEEDIMDALQDEVDMQLEEESMEREESIVKTFETNEFVQEEKIDDREQDIDEIDEAGTIGLSGQDQSASDRFSEEDLDEFVDCDVDGEEEKSKVAYFSADAYENGQNLMALRNKEIDNSETALLAETKNSIFNVKKELLVDIFSNETKYLGSPLIKGEEIVQREDCDQPVDIEESETLATSDHIENKNYELYHKREDFTVDHFSPDEFSTPNADFSSSSSDQGDAVEGFEEADDSSNESNEHTEFYGKDIQNIHTGIQKSGNSSEDLAKVVLSTDLETELERRGLESNNGPTNSAFAEKSSLCTFNVSKHEPLNNNTNSKVIACVLKDTCTKFGFGRNEEDVDLGHISKVSKSWSEWKKSRKNLYLEKHRNQVILDPRVHRRTSPKETLEEELKLDLELHASLTDSARVSTVNENENPRSNFLDSISAAFKNLDPLPLGEDLVSEIMNDFIDSETTEASKPVLSCSDIEMPSLKVRVAISPVNSEITEVTEPAFSIACPDSEMPALEISTVISPVNSESLEMPCLEAISDHFVEVCSPNCLMPDLNSNSVTPSPERCIYNEENREPLSETFGTDEPLQNWPYLEEEVFSETPRNQSPVIETTCSGQVYSPAPSYATDSDTPSSKDFTNVPCERNIYDKPFNALVKARSPIPQLKCSLSWDKIFNLSKTNKKNLQDIGIKSSGPHHKKMLLSDLPDFCKKMNGKKDKKRSSLQERKDEFDLELGPATIEVRLKPNGNRRQWNVVDGIKTDNVPEMSFREENNNIAESGNQTRNVKSPLVVVQRIILKRRAEETHNLIPNEVSRSQLSCLTTPPESDDGLPSQKALPKVVIKRTRHGHSKYQSFLRLSEGDGSRWQPVVQIERNQLLENMVKKHVFFTNLPRGNVDKENEQMVSPKCDSFLCEASTVKTPFNNLHLGEHGQKNTETNGNRSSKLKGRKHSKVMKDKASPKSILRRMLNSSKSNTGSNSTVYKLFKPPNTDQQDAQVKVVVKHSGRRHSDGCAGSSSQIPERRQRNISTNELSMPVTSQDSQPSVNIKHRPRGRPRKVCSESVKPVTVAVENVEFATEAEEKIIVADPETFTCLACKFVFEEEAEMTAHVQTHSYHCQKCNVAFIAEPDFESHLLAEHSNTKQLHHCLLCKLCFACIDEHAAHVASEAHLKLELTQRWTIQTLFALFTGAPCSQIAPLTDAEAAEMSSLAETVPGVINYYHQPTPLQLAVQDLLGRGVRSPESETVTSEGTKKRIGEN